MLYLSLWEIECYISASDKSNGKSQLLRNGRVDLSFWGTEGCTSASAERKGIPQLLGNGRVYLSFWGTECKNKIGEKSEITSQFCDFSV